MRRRGAKRLLRPIRKILNIPLLYWVMLGFTFSFLYFFMRPIFLNSSLAMKFPNTIPAIKPIGVDLRQMLSYSEALIVGRQSPYIGRNLYPPFASIFFAPLLAFEYKTAFRILTFTTLLAYLYIGLIFPASQLRGNRVTPVIMLLFISGLLSYGLQFEIERGQFNVIAMAFLLASIHLFHKNPSRRAFAYLLFSVAVQLKIYPAIFAAMLIGGKGDIKRDLARIVSLITANLGALFILGPSVFQDFIHAISKQMYKPLIWVGNHSVASFAKQYSPEQASSIKLLFFAFFAVCFGAAIWLTYHKEWPGLNPYLSMACAIGALTIPSVSHDYTLSILVAPSSLLLTQLQIRRRRAFIGLSQIALVILFSALYSTTLYSYKLKTIMAVLRNILPTLMVRNIFPTLMAMLAVVTILSLLERTELKPVSNPRGV